MELEYENGRHSTSDLAFKHTLAIAKNPDRSSHNTITG
jgi:hypothetical protein